MFVNLNLQPQKQRIVKLKFIKKNTPRRNEIAVYKCDMKILF